MESVKVYRNPLVRAELAETFTIEVTFQVLENGTRPPTSISLGAEKSGYFENNGHFTHIPRSLGPREIEVGGLVPFSRSYKAWAVLVC